jgi:hypothetical protein
MINDAFWAAAAYGTGLIEIDREECLQLLAAKSVGRIAYATDAGARILPVNYILVDGSIIFRTVPDGEIYHHALSSICAFEIDEPNEFFESGWSVVVLGRLELATEEDFARMLYGKLLQPLLASPWVLTPADRAWMGRWSVPNRNFSGQHHGLEHHSRHRGAATRAGHAPDGILLRLTGRAAWWRRGSLDRLLPDVSVGH